MVRSARVSAGHRAGVSLSALAELRAARSSEGGQRRVEQVRLRDEGEIYSEVTEEEYAALVAERRLAGEFVENDGQDSGYADDGEENWAEYQLAEEAHKTTNRSSGGGRQCHPTHSSTQPAILRIRPSPCHGSLTVRSCPLCRVVVVLLCWQPSSPVCLPVVVRV